MPRTPFQAAIHGFHFGNSFVNHVFRLPPPFAADITTRGRCGGMAFASLDYYFAGQPIPTHVPADFTPGIVPPDGHPLADYIYARLLDSFGANGLTFAAWTQALDHQTWLRGPGVPRMTRQDQVPQLMHAIDVGTPVVLGLVAAGPNDLLLSQIGNNHQVVATGYDVDGAGMLQVYLYDNNHPDQEITLTLNMNDQAAYAQHTDGSRWRGFFVEAYTRLPPRYLDLVVDDGLSVSDRNPPVGAGLMAHYRVINAGVSPAHLSGLAYRVSGPDGQDLSGLLPGGGAPPTLLRGLSWELTSTAPVFTTAPGTYTIEAVYTTTLGHSLLLPAAVNASRSAQVTVHAIIRSMTTAVDPPHVQLSRSVTFTVAARDTEFNTLVANATVWIRPASGAAPRQLGPANEPLSFIFHRVRRGAPPDLDWAYPSGFVRAPAYGDAEIDFGFP